ncbi:helix-turn-helix transcriptional regulator [Euzebya sp.]|uniref:helix-turn-helix transcriptional regulator n=1 Tax=Euzebya sp. TaxID=1971409 RepID=UPI003516FC2A
MVSWPDGPALASCAARAPVPPARHLLRARDLADARYAERIGVDDMAVAAGLSRAHFSREFANAFGETPRQYLLTRRLERAAALLRGTDRTVADICYMVGLESVGSFTTSFRRMFGQTPTAYRAAHAPASALARVPACVVRAYHRPQNRTFREDAADLASVPSSSSPPADDGRADQQRETPT